MTTIQLVDRRRRNFPAKLSRGGKKNKHVNSVIAYNIALNP